MLGLHVNYMTLCFTESQLLPIEVSHCENRDFRPFCFCDLDLDPMTFIYNLDLYFLELVEICRMCENEHLMSRLSKIIVCQTYRQTDTAEITITYLASRVVKKLLRTAVFDDENNTVYCAT